jgi:hypothetical protein
VLAVCTRTPVTCGLDVFGSHRSAGIKGRVHLCTAQGPVCYYVSVAGCKAVHKSSEMGPYLPALERHVTVCGSALVHIIRTVCRATHLTLNTATVAVQLNILNPFINFM